MALMVIQPWRGFELWHLVLAGVSGLLSVAASAHAVLYKREPRSALSWAAFVWFVPLAGPLLYFLFGVNRIRRRARILRRSGRRRQTPGAPTGHPPLPLPPAGGHLAQLERSVQRVVGHPLLPGNRVEPLVDGDEAYPAMLAAIHQARHTVSLETYIFDRDEAGRAFAQALGAAVRRGVAVRVLVDGAGILYSWPTIRHELRREQVPHSLFHPRTSLLRLVSLNLRTHRKILVADGCCGFTGGINIRAGHCLAGHPRRGVRDLHFRVHGPVVSQLQEAFAEDWRFATGERLRGKGWFPPPVAGGSVLARAVPDGPDEDSEKLRWTLLAALAAARNSVRIATPYFLPDSAVISALNLAALRGVEVDILLPASSNLPFVHWASRAMWWQVLAHGCRIWLSPPPFDHSKLMLVDGAWVLLGSANWDARSLRLNFEFNLECYDAALADRLGGLFAARLAVAREVTLAEVDARPWPARLRDGIARLATPYL